MTDGNLQPSAVSARQIVPRAGPDCGLDGDIPRHWLGGDAFRTRFFDAMSTVFPEGEKFFIACVRDYRERIADSQLQQQVKEFIYQEGQHGLVHTRFNERLKAQGIDVERILERQKRIMFGLFRRYLSRAFTLGQTAAAEHLTALMAHGFFERQILIDADPRIRAMYAWHAVEEIEHKAVAYEVLTRVARAGYFTRLLSFMEVSFSFPLHIFMIMRHMLKVDGANRLGVWLRGLWWLYGPRGLYLGLMPHYFAYFLPGFHPWKFGRMNGYRRWREVYDRQGDAIAAGDALLGVR